MKKIKENKINNECVGTHFDNIKEIIKILKNLLNFEIQNTNALFSILSYLLFNVFTHFHNNDNLFFFFIF